MYLTVAGALNPQPSRYLGNIAPSRWWSLRGWFEGPGQVKKKGWTRKQRVSRTPKDMIYINWNGGRTETRHWKRIWDKSDLRSLWFYPFKKNGHWNKIQRLQPTALQKGQTGETEKKCQASAEVAANSSIQPHARSRQNMRTEDMVCTTAAWILATVFRMTLAPQ